MRTSADFPYDLPPGIDSPIWAAVVAEIGLPLKQAQVVSCVLRGKSDKEIASECSVTRATVRTHLKRIFARIGVRDRTSLAVHALAVASQLNQRTQASSDPRHHSRSTNQNEARES